MRERRADAGGFTLVELIVVIALLGLLLGVVGPRMGITKSIGSTSRQLSGMIRSLGLAAAATQQIYRLYLDMDQQSYWAVFVDADGEKSPRDPALAQRVDLPQSVRFRDAVTMLQGKSVTGRAVIQFYPMGRTEQAVVHLIDENQTSLTLVLNPLTGRIHILDGYVDPALSQPVPEQYRPLLFPRLFGTVGT